MARGRYFGHGLIVNPFTAQRLFRVEDTFEVPGRFFVVLPDAEIPAGALLRVNDSITFKRDGRPDLHTRILALEFPAPNPKRIIGIALDPALTVYDIPPGAEVWTGPFEAPTRTDPVARFQISDFSFGEEK